MQFRKLHNTGENFLTESGVFGHEFKIEGIYRQTKKESGHDHPFSFSFYLGLFLINP